MEYGQRPRSMLLAQILSRMQQQQQFQPQSYGALAAGLGAQYLNNKAYRQEESRIADEEKAQQQALVQALTNFSQQSQGIPGATLQNSRIDESGQRIPQNIPLEGIAPDPQGAKSGLLSQLAGINHPLAQGASQAILAQMLAPQAAPEKVDTGDAILFMRDGEVVGAIPKGVTPDTKLREQGETNRLGIREEGEDRRLGVRETGEDRRLGARLAQDRENQGITNSRELVKNTQALRKEFNDLQSVKDYKTSLPIIESAVNAPDTPQGDLQLVYSVGKLLDPNSVVREGELALVIDANSPLQKIFGTARLNLTGGGRITPQAREQIMEMLNQRVGAYRQAYEQDYGQYAEYAKRQGADPEEVVGKRADEAFQKRGAIQIQSDAEYDKLPSGAIFIGPDGKTRRKP